MNCTMRGCVRFAQRLLGEITHMPVKTAAPKGQTLVDFQHVERLAPDHLPVRTCTVRRGKQIGNRLDHAHPRAIGKPLGLDLPAQAAMGDARIGKVAATVAPSFSSSGRASRSARIP